MAKYLVLFTFHGETIKRFLKHPEDRSKAVDEAARSLGGSLESYYWMFGQHDGLAILDLPDSKAAARLSLTVSSTGAFSHLETHELLSAQDVLELASTRARVEYAAPGGAPAFMDYGMP